MNKKITIITPTFNIIKEGRKESLIKNIISVHNQTWDNIEHLIIDGASKDGTLELIEELSRDYKLRVISEKDDGLYYAMNKGVRLADGEYILILNSDDFFISNNALEWSIKEINKENADFSYAKAKCVDQHGQETPMPNCYAPNISYIYTEMMISHQTILCSKKMFENNLFDTSMELGSDYKWLLRACLKGAKPVFVDSFIVEFHRGGRSDRLKYYRKYLEERVATLFEVFREIDLSVTEFECKIAYHEQFLGDKLFRIAKDNSKFDVLRGYKEKTLNLNDMLENAWQETSKNTLLLRLFLSYSNQLTRGISLADILKEEGYERCGIYGYGNLGQCAYIDLINHGFEVTYVVDRAHQILAKDSLKCTWYSPDDEIQDTDVLLVTPVFNYREIYEVMKEKVRCPIVSFDDLVQK